MLKSGDKIEGPDGMGYTIMRDIEQGDAIMTDMFEAYGGAPEAKAGNVMPEFLLRVVFPEWVAQQETNNAI